MSLKFMTHPKDTFEWSRLGVECGEMQYPGMDQKQFEGIDLRAYLPSGTLVSVGKADREPMTRWWGEGSRALSCMCKI